MTLQVNGADIMAIAETAAWVGSIVAAVVVSFIVYLMVRPPRHVRASRKQAREADPAEADELWRIVDLMDRRLELLERALADRIERPRSGADDEERGIFAPAEQGREPGRKK